METAALKKVLHYHIHKKLGSGFAGDLYEAWDSGLDRIVTLRIIRDELAKNEAFASQLSTSAFSARELDHPNICRCYGVEESDSIMIAVMEYVPGEMLSKRIEQGPFDINQFLDFAVQISEGLKALHDTGLTHKYITSDNIIISDSGAPKFLDISIAPTPDMIRQEDELIAANKLAYFAPEMLDGHSASIYSDQYTLGVVFYECLTGKLPFKGVTRKELIEKIGNSKPLDHKNSEIKNGHIVLLINKMIDKVPSERFTDAAELITTLKEIEEFNKKGITVTNIGPKGQLKSRIYLMTSLVVLLVVAFWLLFASLSK
ncbi:MAG: serine/threonine protein kinase [candidate division Zixibacteria bacterium]|nr:serine/threonine protein kinase [candidate division Zixibacteria bacterium]